VQKTQPELHGPAYWQAVLKVMWAPDKSELHPYEAFELPGDVTAVQFDERKRIIIRTKHGVLRLTVLAADLVQITFYANSDQISGDSFSYSVIKPENAWRPTEAFVLETENLVEINSGALKILVDKQPCSLTIQDKSGKYLLRNLQVGHHPNGQQIICRANYDKQTAFYGLGEKTGSLNHAGRKFELWNSDPLNYDPGVDPIYMSIPFLVSLADGKAAGLFFDNSYRSWVDLGASKPGTLEYRALKGEFRLYVMVGTPQTVLERYTELTGRMSLLPLWALGFQQSRWSYVPQSRLLEIARTFRERRIPCDALYLDIDYMDGFRCFTWNRKHFPNPALMLADLHA
jgi:alpha-glucosidase